MCVEGFRCVVSMYVNNEGVKKMLLTSVTSVTNDFSHLVSYIEGLKDAKEMILNSASDWTENIRCVLLPVLIG